MLITLQNKDFNIKNISVLEKVPNTIITDSYFYKIMYEENEVSINGIYLYFTLNNIKAERVYNKIKFTFNLVKNKDTIYNLVQREKEIIDYIKDNNIITSKTPIYHIRDILQGGTFKVFGEKCCTSKFILKISGIWSNENQYGVSYKFFCVTNKS